jgi:hypothetical protein
MKLNASMTSNEPAEGAIMNACPVRNVNDARIRAALEAARWRVRSFALWG